MAEKSSAGFFDTTGHTVYGNGVYLCSVLMFFASIVSGVIVTFYMIIWGDRQGIGGLHITWTIAHLLMSCIFLYWRTYLEQSYKTRTNAGPAGKTYVSRAVSPIVGSILLVLFSLVCIGWDSFEFNAITVSLATDCTADIDRAARVAFVGFIICDGIGLMTNAIISSFYSVAYYHSGSNHSKANRPVIGKSPTRTRVPSKVSDNDDHLEEHSDEELEDERDQLSRPLQPKTLSPKNHKNGRPSPRLLP